MCECNLECPVKDEEVRLCFLKQTNKNTNTGKKNVSWWSHSDKAGPSEAMQQTPGHRSNFSNEKEHNPAVEGYL